VNAVLRELPAGLGGLAILMFLVGGNHLFALAMPCGAVALAMAMFPGAIPPKDIDAAARIRHYVRQAPRARRAAWLMFGATGVLIGLLANVVVGRVR
jgi:hypothetical protein